MSFMSKVKGKRTKEYDVINEEKYTGTDKPVIRSSWEYKFCEFLDNTPRILQWASEPLAIPYYDNAKRDEKGKPVARRYYPDFIAKVQGKDGKDHVYIIEIKPFYETRPPVKGKKSKRTLMREQFRYTTNMCKFKAAKLFCQQRNMEFKIVTEKDLFK